MINKERLIELIKQEATIYNVQCDKLVRKINFADKSEGTYVVGEIESINSSDFVLELNNENENVFAWTLEQLYKTKAEAEFQAEFGNVSKVVKMPVPPTWEEIKGINYIYYTDNGYYLTVDDEIFLCQEMPYDDREIIERYKNTAENYIKALRKMVELFKEEV